MFEIIVAIILLVVLPMAFHKFVTSKYYKLDKEVFDTDNVGTESEDNV